MTDANDILRHDAARPVQALPGLVRRTLIESEHLMLCEFIFEDGVRIPEHSHPHEQAGYVVSGRVRMTISGKDYELGPGDSYRAPSGVLHGAFTLEPTVIVDTFSPPREDYRA